MRITEVVVSGYLYLGIVWLDFSDSAQRRKQVSQVCLGGVLIGGGLGQY